jgi:putative FmdB family regulatory protein
MPIYAYQCAQCGHRFEELILSQNAAATLTCPQCRSDQLVRQMSPFATTVGVGNAARPCGGGG